MNKYLTISLQKLQVLQWNAKQWMHAECHCHKISSTARALQPDDKASCLPPFETPCREGEESEDDFDQQLRQVNLPLLHPKATVTSDHHPCGAELLEFPFSAKAFYVGKPQYNSKANLLALRGNYLKALVNV